MNSGRDTNDPFATRGQATHQEDLIPALTRFVLKGVTPTGVRDWQEGLPEQRKFSRLASAYGNQQSSWSPLCLDDPRFRLKISKLG